MNIVGAGALVVGGASGLGAAVVRKLHDVGANVIVADIDAKRAKALTRELPRAEFAEVDVIDAETVYAAVQRASDFDRGLRISVMCAGVPVVDKTVSKGLPASPDLFQRALQINLMGTFNVLRLAAAEMATNEPTDDGERGVCINTASTAAFDGQVGQIGYSASKAGVVGMTLPAARDLGPLGIRVNTIAPGTFATPMLAGLPIETQNTLAAQIPFPNRLGRPEEFGELVHHMITNQMLNGAVVRLDGGLRMPPR